MTDGRPRAGDRDAATAFGVILVLVMACDLAEVVAPELRYAKYVVPVLALAITAPLGPRAGASPFVRDLRSFVALASFVVAASVAAALWHDAPSGRAYEEAYLAMAPLVSAWLVFPSLRVERIAVYVDWLFLGVTAAYVVECGQMIVVSLSHPGALWGELLTSDSVSESSASFVFGLVALYWLFTRRRGRALAAAVLMVVSFKRSAMLGAVVCGALWGLIRVTRIDLRRSWKVVAVIAILANAIILLALRELSVGNLDDVIARYTGLSADWFTMGREEIYASIFSRFDLGWIGHGLGAVTSHLEAVDATAINAHSDVIKYAVEAGPVLSIAWLWGFYRLARGCAASMLLALYTNIVFVSDNVSIYFVYMFVLYTLIGFLSVDDRGSHALSREVERTR